MVGVVQNFFILINKPFAYFKYLLNVGDVFFLVVKYLIKSF